MENSESNIGGSAVIEHRTACASRDELIFHAQANIDKLDKAATLYGWSQEVVGRRRAHFYSEIAELLTYPESWTLEQIIDHRQSLVENV